MRRPGFLALLLVALLIPLAAWAYYPPLGRLVSAGATINNSTTAAPFTIPAGAVLFVQPDAAVYVCAGTVATTACTATTGVKVAADQFFPLPMSSAYVYVAILPVSGAANATVFADAP